MKVVHEQSGEVEYERERLLGIADKLMNFQSGSQQPSRSYSTFPLFSWTTLIEIAVYGAQGLPKARSCKTRASLVSAAAE
jgi:hypothetical protein